ncbi:molecular chaperone TorD family protein [Neobacillus niacini]|uniref:TorD/DmsD family molecular chaperone n=1 Tax=Neobacillus niacini TaxID=86668 RepID=UPI002FFFB963
MFTIEETKMNESHLLHSRYYLNQLIRLIFDMPLTIENLAILKDPQFVSLCEISEGCRLIEKATHSIQAEDDETLQLLQEEYKRLFIGPNALPAPPWESVYLGKEHLLFEEVTLEVRECYRQYGLSFIREGIEPDDHLVIELEFLSFLIQKTIESDDVVTKKKLLEHQHSFLSNHLLRWCHAFCELLSKSTSFELYQGAALLLEEYLNLENELIPALNEAL